MKGYPVVKVKQLPKGYYHCKVVWAAQIRLSCCEAFFAQGNQVMREAYLKQALSEMYQALDISFVGAQGSRIEHEGSSFMLFKSNIDRRLLQTFIASLCRELNDYCDHQLQFEWMMMEVLTYIEGREPSLLGSFKMKKPLLESEEYQNGFHPVVIHDRGGYAKYLTSWKEFKEQYILESNTYCI